MFILYSEVILILFIEFLCCFRNVCSLFSRAGSRSVRDDDRGGRACPGRHRWPHPARHADCTHVLAVPDSWAKPGLANFFIRSLQNASRFVMLIFFWCIYMSICWFIIGWHHFGSGFGFFQCSRRQHPAFTFILSRHAKTFRQFFNIYRNESFWHGTGRGACHRPSSSCCPCIFPRWSSSSAPPRTFLKVPHPRAAEQRRRSSRSRFRDPLFSPSTPITGPLPLFPMNLHESTIDRGDQLNHDTGPPSSNPPPWLIKKVPGVVLVLPSGPPGRSQRGSQLSTSRETWSKQFQKCILYPQWIEPDIYLGYIYLTPSLIQSPGKLTLLGAEKKTTHHQLTSLFSLLFFNPLDSLFSLPEAGFCEFAIYFFQRSSVRTDITTQTDTQRHVPLMRGWVGGQRPFIVFEGPSAPARRVWRQCSSGASPLPGPSCTRPGITHAFMQPDLQELHEWRLGTRAGGSSWNVTGIWIFVSPSYRQRWLGWSRLGLKSEFEVFHDSDHTKKQYCSFVNVFSGGFLGVHWTGPRAGFRRSSGSLGVAHGSSMKVIQMIPPPSPHAPMRQHQVATKGVPAQGESINLSIRN